MYVFFADRAAIASGSDDRLQLVYAIVVIDACLRCKRRRKAI